MAYKLVISERAERHIDNIIDYVVNILKNPGAARAILSDIEEAYDKLEYITNFEKDNRTTEMDSFRLFLFKNTR